MSLPTGQRGNPCSGRDTAPRNPACGSSVQIPGAGPAWPCRGEWRALSYRARWEAHILWAAAAEGRLGVSAQEGEAELGPPTRPTPFFPPWSWALGGTCSCRGRWEAGGKEVTSSGAKGIQDCAQRPQVPPFPHPPYSDPHSGGTICNCLVLVITVGPHFGGD